MKLLSGTVYDDQINQWILNSDFTLNTKAMLTKIRLREITQK